MRKYLSAGIPIFPAVIAFLSCHSPQAGGGYTAPPPDNLPVITVTDRPFTAYREYTASLEGSNDIEIRPQVAGYIEKIFVDEGAIDDAARRIEDPPLHLDAEYLVTPADVDDQSVNAVEGDDA